MGGDVEFPGGSMRCCALWRGWMAWVTGSGVRVTVKHSVYDVCVYDLFSLLYTYWVVHIKRGKFALWGLKMHKLLHALSSAYQWAQQAWLVWDLGYPDVSLSFCAFAKKKKIRFFLLLLIFCVISPFFPIVVNRDMLIVLLWGCHWHSLCDLINVFVVLLSLFCS